MAMMYFDHSTECAVGICEDDGNGTTQCYSTYATGKALMTHYNYPTSATYDFQATTKTFSSNEVSIPWTSDYTSSTSYYQMLTNALLLGEEVTGAPASEIYHGSTNIESLNLGSGAISEVYVGSTQVY